MCMCYSEICSLVDFCYNSRAINVKIHFHCICHIVMIFALLVTPFFTWTELATDACEWHANAYSERSL